MKMLKTFIVMLAKKIYDRFPWLVKISGLLELVRFSFYRKIYFPQIDRKMQEFSKGHITIEFETTNSCNADCVMCPNSLMKRGPQRMSIEKFTAFVDEIASEKLPIIKFVFAGLGEPTLDPGLPEKVKYLKAKLPEIPVQVTTNASLLNEKRALELINAGLDQVIISFNGTSKESYEKVMGGLNFEQTIQNVEKFLSLRRNNLPQVTISCVRLDVNADEVANFSEFWQKRGLNVEHYKTPVPFNRGGEQMAGRYTSAWALPSPRPSHLIPCRMMAENLLIHPDGTVPLCFADYEETAVLGRLGQLSLREILAAKDSVFAQHRRGDFSKTEICKKCTFMREQSVAWWKEGYF